MMFVQLSEFHPSLLAIEQAAHVLPWDESMLQSSFAPMYEVVGLWVENQMVGFYISQHVAQEATLMNIAVHPQYQGKGYGSALLNNFLIRYSCFENDAWSLAVPIFLEVRESNESAIRLYERFKFKRLGCRPNYYPVPKSSERETAIVYGKNV
ncbi:MAG: ribosomal-protein-alanine acetyltransferase RimI [Idiomarinaceae bacterium HL-53]|nr:MAG: ribosomal-protein-alanine acetyltransferase RimI [Idiomarinaceae bacterium HL-53]CUS49430.1 ribosomal-protein-alanine N-acetyltransferase [Idiomarinaceae bacterium HL-53]